MVELRPANLIGVGQLLVPGLGEIERRRRVMIRRYELDAEFQYADALDLGFHAKFLEQRNIHRQQRLTNVEPWMAVLVDKQNSLASFSKQRCHCRSGRSAPDYQYVKFGITGPCRCIHQNCTMDRKS